MSDTPELSRRFALRRLGAGLSTEDTITANAAECARLAERFGLPAIASLSCRFRMTSGTSHSVLVEGWLAAQVTQISVISGEAFEDAVAETFTVRFVPENRFAESDGIDLDAPDVLPYEGDSLDLGELLAEQLALALDPYPRRPGEGLDQAVDVVPQDEAPMDGDKPEDGRPNPFAALAARRDGGH